MTEVTIKIAENIFNAQVIFVGDENQLPSVGPGNVFHDFIASGLFETVRTVFNL